MGKTSWVVTLSPLIIALATTVKSFLTAEDLTANEVEIIKFMFGAFVGSGAIGAWLASQGKKSN